MKAALPSPAELPQLVLFTHHYSYCSAAKTLPFGAPWSIVTIPLKDSDSDQELQALEKEDDNGNSRKKEEVRPSKGSNLEPP